MPHISSQTAATTYARPGGYRVDVLTTNRGKDRDEPVALPSLKTDAVPLRFLDFLLKETVQAPVLSKTGVLINVPTPERYAVHKLIVATMRHAAGESAAKVDKDIAQVATLIEAFAAKRRLDDFEDALREAKKRGAGWRDRLKTGASRLPDEIKNLSRLLD